MKLQRLLIDRVAQALPARPEAVIDINHEIDRGKCLSNLARQHTPGGRIRTIDFRQQG